MNRLISPVDGLIWSIIYLWFSIKRENPFYLACSLDQFHFRWLKIALSSEGMRHQILWCSTILKPSYSGIHISFGLWTFSFFELVRSDLFFPHGTFFDAWIPDRIIDTLKLSDNFFLVFWFYLWSLEFINIPFWKTP